MFKGCLLFEKKRTFLLTKPYQVLLSKQKLFTYHRTLSSILLSFLGSILIIFSLRVFGYWNEIRTP